MILSSLESAKFRVPGKYKLGKLRLAKEAVYIEKTESFSSLCTRFVR